jgi:hypothetical protein
MSHHPQALRPQVLASENCLLQPNFGENPFYEVR